MQTFGLIIQIFAVVVCTLMAVLFIIACFFHFEVYYLFAAIFDLGLAVANFFFIHTGRDHDRQRKV